MTCTTLSEALVETLDTRGAKAGLGFIGFAEVA
jgi:hypothetical protein